MNARLRSLSGIVLASMLAGCGSAALSAAEHGDSAKLRAEIAAKHARGRLGNREAASLAHAVAERELETAKDEAEALARLARARSCALELDDVLAARMKKRDGVGAEAALLRLESGQLGEGRARDFLDDADDRWRAVAAPTLHRGSDRQRRHKAFLDPSAKVRRGAIRAAGETDDVTDLPLLFETARVDPEPMLRNEAVRSMGKILRSADDGARAADFAVRARDLWTAGDDGVREDLAVAWALTPVFEHGGREALRVAIAEGKGPGAIAAAAAVLRVRPTDVELAGAATGLLVRALGEGSRRDRLHALAAAPASGPMVEAMKKIAASEDDTEARVAALARLLEAKTERDAARAVLVRIAAYGAAGTRSDDADALENALRARAVLASHGELRIQAWLEEDLASADPHRKSAAASALAALGRPARAAPLLTDPDAALRLRAACTMLVASRH